MRLVLSKAAKGLPPIPLTPAKVEYHENTPPDAQKRLHYHTLAHFGVTPDAIHHAALGSALPSNWKATVSAHAHENGVGFNYQVHDEKGKKAIRRSVQIAHSSEGGTPHTILGRDNYDISEEHQGKGIAHATDQALEHLAHHIHRATKTPVKLALQANKDVGGYAWAKAGYKYDSHADREMHADQMRKRLDQSHDALKMHGGGDLTLHEHNEINRHIKGLVAKKADPAEFANLDIPGVRIAHPKFPEHGIHVGKALTLGSEWNGHKWIGATRGMAKEFSGKIRPDTGGLTARHVGDFRFEVSHNGTPVAHIRRASTSAHAIEQHLRGDSDLIER